MHDLSTGLWCRKFLFLKQTSNFKEHVIQLFVFFTDLDSLNESKIYYKNIVYFLNVQNVHQLLRTSLYNIHNTAISFYKMSTRKPTLLIQAWLKPNPI